MGHSRSHEASLTPDQAEALLDIAEASIRAHLDGSRYSGPDLSPLPERLRQPRGAFVTLNVDGRLNGCIGNIQGDEPIGTGISKLAVQAAFADPRLPRLRREDLDRLDIEVSLLSPPTVVPATSRSELIEQLIPHETGLIISSGSRRAVFLPSVWAQLPLPDDFIDQLLRKAGLPTDRWPRDLRAEVFTTESFGRRAR